MSAAAGWIAEWAEQHGHLATAFEFAQGAAYLSESAMQAYTAGRLARSLGEYDLAESWFLYTFRIARTTKDWRAYALACSGMGNMCYQLGNLPRARFYQTRKLRFAKRHYLHQQQAEALHDLFLLASECGDLQRRSTTPKQR